MEGGMSSTVQDWRALPVFLFLAVALSEYPFVLHAFGVSGNPNPNPLGLLVAALIAAAVDSGWRGPAALLASIVRVRVSPVLWLAAVTLPLLTLTVTLAIALAASIVILTLGRLGTSEREETGRPQVTSM
jgi:hypothetical protein